MKRIATWAMIVALAVFVIDWGVLGIKISMNDYDFMLEVYIGAACLAVMFICIICRAIGDKCPYCGKMRISHGKYCPFCGKEI